MGISMGTADGNALRDTRRSSTRVVSGGDASQYRRAQRLWLLERTYRPTCSGHSNSGVVVASCG